MKLPTDFPKIEALLEQLGVESQPFVLPKIKKALVGSGIIVTTDEIVVKPNGTLEYQGQKVILYIRDVMGTLPKYHVVNCRTLQAMRRAGRYKRYVVTRRTDGEFILNFADNLSRSNPETYRLDICKNCLWHELNLKYVYAPDAFPLDDWFNAIDPNYEPPPQDGIYGPRTTRITGPISNYPPDWSLRSLQCRKVAEWKCEECSVDLKLDRKFLHTHHLRGPRYNQPIDLRSLCIGCHAEKPGNGHQMLKHHPDYRDFMRQYGSEWRSYINSNPKKLDIEIGL